MLQMWHVGCHNCWRHLHKQAVKKIESFIYAYNVFWSNPQPSIPYLSNFLQSHPHLPISCSRFLNPLSPCNATRRCRNVGPSTGAWTDSLSGTPSLKKMESPSPNSQQLPVGPQLGVRLCGSLPCPCKLWAGMILCRSCAFCLNHCEFMYAMACHFYPILLNCSHLILLVLTIFFIPTSVRPLSLVGGSCSIEVPFRAEHYTVFFSVHGLVVGLFVDPHLLHRELSLRVGSSANELWALKYLYTVGPQ